jgi:hypothetical protein
MDLHTKESAFVPVAWETGCAKISAWRRKCSFTVMIRLRAEQSRVRIPARIGDLSVLQNVQLIPVSTQPPSLWVLGGFLRGIAAGE